MMGRQRAEKALQVFSVSSHVFSLIVEGETDEGLKKGFFTKAETGIPEFRDALIATTWNIREQKAHTFNAEVESSLTRLKLWAADTSSDYKMLPEERAILDSRLENRFNQLEEVCLTQFEATLPILKTFIY